MEFAEASYGSIRRQGDQFFPVHREGFACPVPVQRLMMREWLCLIHLTSESTKTRTNPGARLSTKVLSIIWSHSILMISLSRLRHGKDGQTDGPHTQVFVTKQLKSTCKAQKMHNLGKLRRINFFNDHDWPSYQVGGLRLPNPLVKICKSVIETFN